MRGLRSVKKKINMMACLRVIIIYKRTYILEKKKRKKGSFQNVFMAVRVVLKLFFTVGSWFSNISVTDQQIRIIFGRILFL